MKAKKLRISDHDLGREVTFQDPETGEKKTERAMYKIVESLVSLLLSPRLALPVGQYLDSSDLARRLKTAHENGDENVLLDAKEYELLRNAIEKTPGQTQQGPVGFAPDDEELVSRVMRPEEVEVDEAAVLKMPVCNTVN